MPTIDDVFPSLTRAEIDGLRPVAETCEFADGDVVFQAGHVVDFYVIESGTLVIVDPNDHQRIVVEHQPGQFSGDIDLLTGRPVIITGIARGATRLLRVPQSLLRETLNRIPVLSEKLMIAFTLRREALTKAGDFGLRIVGPAHCRDTTLVREFLYKNFVPFSWLDSQTEAGQKLFERLGESRRSPKIECPGGKVLIDPTLRELAQNAGIWRACPEREFDLTIVGAGPAGLTSAVYAASEGLRTLLLDRIGPGGQAGGSSRIENFIGFPAGLSGADFAMRGVLQALKFGVQIITPIDVQRIEVGVDDAPHTLHLDCGSAVKSRVTLVAAGVRWRKLAAEGAERFERAGVFYACTSVETMLYDKQDVAVVGAGNSAGQAAMFLAECCPSRKVYMIIRNELGPGMSSYLADRIRAARNIVLREHAEIIAVHGTARPEAIVVARTGETTGERLPCAAAFVFIGAEPSVDWLPPEIARDEHGYVLTGGDVSSRGLWPRTDREPCPLETSIPGILVAGDLRAGSTKRVGFAVGDGSLAVTCVHRLLAGGR